MSVHYTCKVSLNTVMEIFLLQTMCFEGEIMTGKIWSVKFMTGVPRSLIRA